MNNMNIIFENIEREAREEEEENIETEANNKGIADKRSVRK